MKKFLSAAAVVLVLALIVSAIVNNINKGPETEDLVRERLESKSSLYPVYKRLDLEEKEAYIEICAAFEDFSETTSYLYASESEKEALNFRNKMNSIYREIAYEQSEMFWVDPYNVDFPVYEYDGEFRVVAKPKYILEKEEALEKQKIFNQKVEQIVSQAELKATTYDKVLFVHDYILENAVYDNSLAESENFSTTGINAYGCLIDGKTICSGYTLAFDVIMKRLGIECGAEFSSYSMISIFEGHVWNYCNLDGEYYYFDLTWDDIAPDSALAKYIDYYHCYFAIDAEELKAARLALPLNSPAPVCRGTKYNYFVYNNRNFNTYDFNSVKTALLLQSTQKYAAVRFESYTELLKAKSDLIDNGKIFEIFPNISSVDYLESKSNLQLYIFLK